MDTGKLVWLFRNINRYEFVGQEAIQIREAISRMLITEDSIRSEAIVLKLQEQYDRLTKLFYNNIIGYKNGLAMVGVLAAELDCYFVETADGLVPIGYYREIRPAEAATLVQRYLDKCREDVSKEKNGVIERWQRYLNGISARYESIKNDGHPSGVRAAVAAVFAAVLLVLAVVSMILLNPIQALLNWDDGYTVMEIMENIPLLGLLEEAGWVLHFIGALIMIAVAAFLIFMICREFALLGAKQTTAKLVNNMMQYVVSLEQGIAQDANGGDNVLYEAARRGENAGAIKNANVGLIVSVEQQIQTASVFVNKEKRHRKGVLTWVIVIAIVLSVFNPLAYAQFLADGIQSLQQGISIGGGNGGQGAPDDPQQPVVIGSEYEFVLSDGTWNDAVSGAQARGGQLVSVNSEAEFNEICALVDAENVNREKDVIAFWVGANCISTGSWWDAKWLDGEGIYFEKWLPGEPTGYSEDGVPEEYLLVFRVDGEWYYNDTEVDVEKHYGGKMGYIVETKVYAN